MRPAWKKDAAKLGLVDYLESVRDRLNMVIEMQLRRDTERLRALQQLAEQQHGR